MTKRPAPLETAFQSPIVRVRGRGAARFFSIAAFGNAPKSHALNYMRYRLGDNRLAGLSGLATSFVMVLVLN